MRNNRIRLTDKEMQLFTDRVASRGRRRIASSALKSQLTFPRPVFYHGTPEVDFVKRRCPEPIGSFEVGVELDPVELGGWTGLTGCDRAHFAAPDGSAANRRRPRDGTEV